MGDDDLRTLHEGWKLFRNDPIDIAMLIARRQTSFRCIDADIIGSGIFTDQIEPRIGAVGLRIDGEKFRPFADQPDQGGGDRSP